MMIPTAIYGRIVKNISFLVIALMAVCVFALRDCACDKKTPVFQKTSQVSTESTFVQPAVAQIPGQEIQVTKTVYVPQIVYRTKLDSTAIHQVEILLKERDSINRILRSHNVASIFSLDTNIQDIQLHVDCNDVERSISATVRTAPRTIEYERSVLVVTEKPSFSFGPGISYGVGIDGKFHPQVSISAHWSLLSF